MDLANPHFAEPIWLWLAFLGPVAVFALQRYAAFARRKQMARIAAPEFLTELTRSHSPGRRLCKELMLVAVVFDIGLALARPQWGVQRADRTQLTGDDVVFVLDCSSSMMASDVSPNRLHRAKLAIMDFVGKHAGGRVGLVAFAGQAFLQCPLTPDHDAFRDALMAMDDKTIPVSGTDVGRALDEAFLAMDKEDQEKLIVLITDGEDLEKSGVKKAELLAKQGVVVYTIGVGTPAGGLIQTLNEQGQPTLLRDSKGEAVRSQLDETTLRAIAAATRGEYRPLGPLGEGLARLRNAIDRRQMTAAGGAGAVTGVDRFHLFIAAALSLVVIESLCGTRRKTA
jgi:Ca-activated chloride channel family protein